MNVLTENLKRNQDLERMVLTEAVRCLGDGLDTPRMDDFLDQMFDLASERGHAAISLLTGGLILRVESKNLMLLDLEVPRAKTKLRMLCARLAVRCAAWANREFSPYGDTVEFEHPTAKRTCKVSFENTTGTQKFSIETI